MPRLNSERTKLLVAQVFKADGHQGVKKLAEVTGIPYGALRNAVAGRDHMHLTRIVDVAAALGVSESYLIAGDNDGVPDEPPPQPEPAPKPPPRREEKAGQGPKRVKQRIAS